MKRLLFVAAACAALSVSTATLAAPAPAPAQPQAGQPSDRKIELTRRYMVAMNMHNILATMTNGMLEKALADPSLAKMPDEMHQAFVDSMREATAEMLLNVEARYSETVAERFTVEELEALVTFYESPTGRSIIVKTGQLAAETGALTEQFSGSMMIDFEGRFCSRIKEKPGCLGIREKTKAGGA